ncbi:MAG: hypothetical protein AAGU27_23445 [Dehalobacterium sp.]
MKNKMHKLTVIFFVATLVVIFSSVALASYIHNALLNSYIATAGEEFYFTSDLLTDDSIVPTYQITHDWQTNSAATISFQLRNYENTLNISDREIAYTVAAVPESDSFNGTISPGGISGKTETVNIIVPQPEDSLLPLEVIVTATATSPYLKTLRGKFIISPAISYHMEENAGAPVATLTITLAQSEELSRNVSISWPEGADPDMTNFMVIDALDASSIDLVNRTMTISLNTAAIYELVFFKDGGEINYTGVTVTTGP